MDADTANLIELQKITKKYDAFLMIDSAHDFGCMGPTGNFSKQHLANFCILQVNFIPIFFNRERYLGNARLKGSFECASDGRWF